MMLFCLPPTIICSPTTKTKVKETTAAPSEKKTCQKLYVLCDQTRSNFNPDFGRTKPCDDCLRECRRTGEWDFVKCPIFE